MKKLTIITVCLNEPKLERTCASIVEQTFQDFEWIVVDGGSDRATLDIFEKYKSRIDCFISEKDSGIYDAMNKGIAQAKGEWLNFMNAGDRFFAPETLENIFSDPATCADCDIIAGSCEFENPPDARLQYLAPPPEIDLCYLYAHTIAHQAAFIKRALFAVVGGYDTNFQIAADYKQWISFCRHGYKFKCVSNIIAVNAPCGISGSLQWRKRQIAELAEIRMRCFTREESSKGMEFRQRNFKNVADYVRGRNVEKNQTIS
ncbi:MAG: glycosyltransferase [Desulfovibrio sp.]|jgi:glycosyltransferase involved in cell wall biosynthesis|nr:glycosyltransferase [Desulfovibrio sp.]